VPLAIDAVAKRSGMNRMRSLVTVCCSKALTLAIRALYVTAIGRRVVVVRAFVKKTQKTPRCNIDLALKRLKELDS